MRTFLAGLLFSCVAWSAEFDCVLTNLSTEDLRNPIIFREAFDRGVRQPELRDIFGWPILEQSLHQLRDALTNQRLRHPNDPDLETLQARVRAALNDRRLSYLHLIELSLDAAIAIDRLLPNRSAPLNPELRNHVATHARNLLRGRNWIIPVFQDEPMGQLELLRQMAAGLAPMQVPSVTTRADGSNMDPLGFALHDLGHAIFAMNNTPSRLTPPPHSAQRPIHGAHSPTHRLLSDLITSAEAIPDARFRGEIMEALFEVFHESGRYLGTILNRIRDLPAERHTILTPREGEWPIDFRQRTRRVYDWLVVRISPHLPQGWRTDSNAQ